MRVGLLAVRWTIRSRRLMLALGLGLIGISGLAGAAPAQAHEPYSAYAWGSNVFGQLGNGSETGPEECGPSRRACSASALKVSGLSGVSVVAGGGTWSLALLEGGTVMAWGHDVNGELGDGTTTSSDVPVEVKGLSGVVAIAAGQQHGLALLSSGKVMAWGNNADGQLGDGKEGVGERSDVPVEVTGLSGVVAIAAGADTSLALLESGKVMAWGFNLGNGSEPEGGEKSDVPVEVKGLSGVAAVSAARGSADSLALLKSGKVMAWGYNEFGQVGNGGTTTAKAPVEVSGLKEVVAIAAGKKQSLALLANGSVVAWGFNAEGQLGDGTSTGPETCGMTMTACSKTPVAVSGLSAISAIAAFGSSLALHGGAAVDWGPNGEHQLGLSSPLPGPEPCGPEACSTKPLQVQGLSSVKGIAAGELHNLAVGPSVPVVSGVSPDQPNKRGTAKVTITGSEFEEASEVKFGSAKATSVVVKENGTIVEATSPAGKGTVDVTVTTPMGTSATSEADRFYYSRPTVKRLSPRKGPELGGTSVTITGTNFAGATAVKFGSSNATSFTVKSETEIVATSPSHPGGFVEVTVSTPNGTSAISKKDRFKYR
jgi:alpha-tubulin suppressor-like RCC1 family protein